MLRRLLLELTQAFALLTRLPIGGFGSLAPRWQGEGKGDASTMSPALSRKRERAFLPHPADCIWAYPIVGAVVGAVGGAWYWLARAIAMPPMLSAIWALAAMVVLTGGFHEDGLADTADGFGGGATRLRKLEIMRDSRIGTFGVLALVLSLAVRGAAIVTLAEPAKVVAALLVTGALGRGAMAGLLLLLQPARSDGLGAAVGRPPAIRVTPALALAVLAAFLLLPPRLASHAILLATASCVAMALLARAQIGGHTGDVLGAGEQFAECVVLTLLGTAMRG